MTQCQPVLDPIKPYFQSADKLTIRIRARLQACRRCCPFAIVSSGVIPKPRAFTTWARACPERSRGGSGAQHSKLPSFRPRLKLRKHSRFVSGYGFSHIASAHESSRLQPL